jgi:flagellar hook-basal body complex protein FliE
MIEAIEAINVASVQPDATPMESLGQSQVTSSMNDISTSFADLLGQGVNTVNHQLLHATELSNKVALGEAVNLHEVVIAMEHAKLSMELAVEVRNRVLEGYQELMRMQI